MEKNSSFQSVISDNFPDFIIKEVIYFQMI